MVASCQGAELIGATPQLTKGVDIEVMNACGAPLLLYKDRDRLKRYDLSYLDVLAVFESIAIRPPRAARPGRIRRSREPADRGADGTTDSVDHVTQRRPEEIQVTGVGIERWRESVASTRTMSLLARARCSQPRIVVIGTPKR